MSTLHEFSDAIASVVKQTSQFVVTVHGGTRFDSAGVVWHPGVVVTTDHTVRQDEDLRVTLPHGKTIAATLAGRDPGTDLAVLKFEGESAARGELSSSLEPGKLALAVGRSADTGPNASLGVVSAVGKPWKTWHGGQLDAYVRLDVTLYPGTSGAAVVDASGAVIGIATTALSRIAPVAVPASTVDRVVREIVARGSVGRPYLGVAVQPIPIPGNLTEAAAGANRGLIVLTSEAAGILVGDILLRVGDASVSHPGELQSVLGRHAPGDKVNVLTLRGGEPKQIEVALQERRGRTE